MNTCSRSKRQRPSTNGTSQGARGRREENYNGRATYVQMNLLPLKVHYQELLGISGEWCGKPERKHQ